MKKNLVIFIKFLVYASFFVPLAVFPRSFIFPFIVPKILIFRSLVAIMFAAYLLLWYLDSKEYRPRLTPIFIALAAFLASFGISTFAGVDAYHSFWDNHERMLGLFTILHFFAYFVVIGCVFKKWSDWRLLFWIFLCAGSIAMFIGILQVGNPDLLLNQGSDRVASTLGNSIYVGGYGLFLAFVAVLLFFKEREIVWRAVAAFLGVLALLGMFYSGTRGSLLGFVLGVGAGALAYALFAKNNQRARKIATISLIVVAFLTVIVVVERKNPLVQKIPAVNRAVSTSFGDLRSSARWIAWEIAWESFRERPAFGWGPNNFFYAFNAHYNPRSLDFGYGETWFDNAHNVIMNTLAVQGGVGLLTYLGLFVVSITVLIRSNKKWSQDAIYLAAGGGFLIAHLAQNILVFENPTSYLYFMVWLAFIGRAAANFSDVPLTAPADKKTVVTAPAVSQRSVGGGALVAVGAVVCIWIFIFNIQPARANMMALRLLAMLGQNYPEVVPAMQEVFRFNSPHIDDIRNDVGRAATNLVATRYQDLGEKRVNEILDVVEPAMAQNALLHPYDIRIYMLQAQIARFRGELTRNVQDVIRAEGFMQQALSYSPKRQQVIFGLSEMELMLNKNAEAEKLLQQAISDNPRVPESYLRLGFMYAQLKLADQAKNVFAEARKNNVSFSAQEEASISQMLTQISTTASPARSPKNK